MDVTISAELEQFVMGKVQSGEYPNATAVVVDALEVLREQERRTAVELEKLREMVAVGAAELDRGEYGVWDPEALKAELMQKYGKGEERNGTRG